MSRLKNIVRDLKDMITYCECAALQIDDLHQGMGSILHIVKNELKYKADVIKTAWRKSPSEMRYTSVKSSVYDPSCKRHTCY